MSGYMRKMARKQLQANRGLMNRVVRDNEALLNAIERLFVYAWRQVEEIDDRICHMAIESALTGQAAQHPLAAMLVNKLLNLRQGWPIVTDAAWQDALRVVAQSIRRHSACETSETSYLDFVDVFIT